VFTLPEAIRSIRKRLGANQAKLASICGVKQNSISLYEKGSIVPSGAVLLHLLHFAEGAERPPILKALGIQALGAGITSAASEAEFADAMKEVEHYLHLVAEQGFPERDITERTAREFLAKETARILSRPRLIRPIIAQILRAWRTHGEVPGAEEVFIDAAAYIEVQLKLLGSRLATGKAEKTVPERKPSLPTKKPTDKGGGR
jgi:transcriptional regulator with XRE-family HTH domain